MIILPRTYATVPNLLLAKVVANLHLRWISTLLFTLLKSNEVDQ